MTASEPSRGVRDEWLRPVLTTKPAIGPQSHMNEVSACESPRVCTEDVGKKKKSSDQNKWCLCIG
jgi:hypothetical protein